MSVDNRELVEKIALSSTKGVHAEIVRRMEEVGIAKSIEHHRRVIALSKSVGVGLIANV